MKMESEAEPCPSASGSESPSPSSPQSGVTTTNNDSPPPGEPQLTAIVAERLRSPFRGIQQRIQRRRARSAPPDLRIPLLEEHFRVDPVKKVVLPGVPKHGRNSARDTHDFFNLIVLIPLMTLNIMNWNWDILLNLNRPQKINNRRRKFKGRKQQPEKEFSLSQAWTGMWFDYFFYFACMYLVADLLWICIRPKCVKSPSTIIQHHLVTLSFLLVIHLTQPELRWMLGASMSAEINTWFLIARRVFNKQGFSPWIIDLSFVSVRIKLISICFFVTWIAIRCILYPILLAYLTSRWWDYAQKVDSFINMELIAPLLHSSFCFLNFKWTYDLLMSKIRYMRRSRRGAASKANKGQKQQ